MKTGFLIHSYHLHTEDWEGLVWGDPEQGRLGVLSKFVDLLLDIPADTEVVALQYGASAVKDGLSEAEYTKRYLVERIPDLTQFPRLRRRIERLSPAEYAMLVQRIRAVEVGPEIFNTAEEIDLAAQRFAEQGITHVIQLAAASHAARCMRLQTMARYEGRIPEGQQWFLVPSEAPYAGSTPADVAVAEPPHRTDRADYGMHPNMPEIVNRFYFGVPKEQWAYALRELDSALERVIDDASVDAPVAK